MQTGAMFDESEMGGDHAADGTDAISFPVFAVLEKIG
jgi:hypothetical protein